VRYAILSDVHGNLEALQAVLGDLAREGADRILFLGDIVGYGADPKECIALVREKTHAIVAGNHDWAAVGKTDVTNFNSAARSAVDWTSAQLSSEETNFLAHLPLQGEEDAFIFVHATPLYPELWSYIFFEYDALQNLKALAQKACFIGHSHIPAVYSLRPTGELSYETAFAEVSLQGGGRFLINVGSVGQPRDGNASAAYGLYDDEKGLFFLRRVRYDIGAAQRKILSAGLPPVLAERIGRGW
jgi:diadenosine tetraphosphatase ApaH/serine/threonine PP2A family protein phosphatase